MALQDLLDISSSRKKVGLSEERIEPIKPYLRKYIAYWREYPDMFIDFLQTGESGNIPESGLKFYFYQRVFLRAAMRYKYVYFVFPRAYSKSFLSVLTLMIRCILYPRAKLFVTSGGKEQAAGIIKEKVDELCNLVPALNRELDRTFLQDLQRDGTYNEASFDREYESKWSGTAENAFFNGETFDMHRILKQPEYEHSGRSSVHSYYILSVDVGRKGCDSVVMAWKVTPQSMGPAIKSLVNIYTLSDTHFEDQAKKLKRLYYKYKARRLVIDANGIGIGLVDYMVKSQNDEVTGEHFPDFGVFGGTQADAADEYKKYRTNETEEDAMYLMKASAPINSEAHANAQTQLNAGKVKMLIDERIAKVKLLDTNAGKKMSPEKRAEYLKPFTLTSILKEEMMNLREENEGINIILKQANKSVKKDKFSAFEYGLYYIKIEEESKKKKKKFKITDMMFSS